MARWTPFNIVGGAYADDNLPWSHQDTVNYLPVPAEKEGTRSRAILRGLPGYALFCDLGTNKPIRGARNVEGRLFVVSGTTLFRVNADGSSTELGTIPGVTRCSLSHNQITGGNEVVISNGQSGYVYNTKANTLAQITDDGFPGAICFESVDSYILGIEPARRFAFTSDLADATAYNTLDRYEAEGAPDLLVGQAVTHREWWLMGERTIEPFVNTGATTGTFQRAQGTVMEVGLAATHAVAVMDNSVFWLGSDGIVYRANGYTPQRISTHAIEQAIRRCNTAQAFAFTFEDGGHKVFYLTFPDGQTWGYDAATGEWHRRKSHNLDRWRINTLTKWNGKWIAGDFSNGKLYQLDWDVQDEDGVEMERRRITGVTHDSLNSLIINGLALMVDTGLPSKSLAPSAALSITGNLPGSTTLGAVSYQYTINAARRPVTVAISTGALPTGLSIDNNGLVTGTTTTKGSYSWTVQVTDADGNHAYCADSAAFGSVTWDPAKKSAYLNLSNGDLTATNVRTSGSGDTSIGATLGREAATANHYFEVTFDLITSNRASDFIGIARTGSSVFTGAYGPGATTDSWGYRANGGYKTTNDAGVAYGAEYFTGDTIGCLLKNGKLYFSKNGTWVGDPVAETGAAFTGLTGTMFPAASSTYTTDKFTGRFSSSSFLHSPPSGSSAWEVLG